MNLRWPVISIAIGILLTGSGTAALGLRLNDSESMPRGFWWAQHFDGTVRRGNVVLVCLPNTPVTARYVDPGWCPDGLKPLLKTVAAVAGDTVELTAEGVVVNGVKLANTAPLQRDGVGRTLTAWPFGVYHVDTGEVWLLSDHSARSFDSRYVGPVDVQLITARAVPLLTWD
jgi:conjugative transfer signal peptidase TraF